jgi:hypothetical protein
MEAIEVTARFASDGTIQPIQFKWRKHIYQVEAIGRSWENHNELHILVMAPEEQVFELLFERSEGQWYLRTTGGNRAAI